VAELKKESIRAEVQTEERQGMERDRAVRTEVAKVEQDSATAGMEVEEVRVLAAKVQGDIKSLEGQKEGLQGEIPALQG
ncbi:hypothetical protein ACKUFN_27130, partial [Escherichia coli]|uniref:hypothetical protein n=1 Tax=Escherichia coli TaxID=562 RepID=UPI00390C4E8B